MNDERLRQTVLEALSSVAPEADLSSLELETPLREELEIDSMDFLNFVIALHETLGIDIPEADYQRFSTLGGAIRYLSSRPNPGPGSSSGPPATA
jgi:acyl carrier protein